MSIKHVQAASKHLMEVQFHVQYTSHGYSYKEFGKSDILELA